LQLDDVLPLLFNGVDWPLRLGAGLGRTACHANRSDSNQHSKPYHIHPVERGRCDGHIPFVLDLFGLGSYVSGHARSRQSDTHRPDRPRQCPRFRAAIPRA
jgi:hypothetical protein